MTLKLFNTLTGKIDEFVSQTPNKVLIYTCGPTVYSYQHIGNLAAYIYWDTLIRILMVDNYQIDRVMNITDVGHLTSDADEGEDKLEKGAKREGKNAWEIAQFYTDDFLANLKKLNIIEPQHIAKATDYIPQQLDLIRKLKDKGCTYQINDGIYFDTSKFPRYADFAHLNLKELQAGARVAYNSEKRNHSDFALWKFTKANEKRAMEWETPADILDKNKDNKPIMGFPGWHLECSAIAMTILGKTIDIHTGGIDHIPIHHTNEIAQTESITGVRLSNYWLHNNHLRINGTKISKSLGNSLLLSDLEEKGFSAADFRMFVLQGHYRNEGNFTFEGLIAAKNRLHNWRNVAALRHQIYDTLQDEEDTNKDIKAFSPYATSQAIVEAIENDLGTPEALRIIDDAFSHITEVKSLSRINRQAFIQLLNTIDSVLGLQIVDSTPDVSDELKKLILKRNIARNNKDWKESDKLREKINDYNIELKDTENNTIWEYR